MTLRRLFPVIGLTFLTSLGLWAFQRFGGEEVYINGEKEAPSEFYFSRLRYNTFGYRGFRGGGWQQDFPRADNDCLIVIRRLTRIDCPAPLNVVDLEDNSIFDYPWIYAVGVNTWGF